MKNTIDFFKIKGGELGAVNFDNMIPVADNNYTLVDLNKETTLSDTIIAQCLQILLWKNKLEISKFIIKDRVTKNNVD